MNLKPDNQESSFVADGRERILETAEYQAAAEAARLEVFARYSAPISRSSGRRRELLEKAAERALARRLELLAPTDALYLYMP